ncbi:unnamed protein product [Ostreobium quekettii]|uniref:Uncharacterized protein n=1 Tax=Ostreobium quekettii TaxID=121088 RepID=A0A8S1JDA9_9CHLO|nr:unnamed protein product [Ostreobium quekettii]|eukprot:evm.model.scf_75.9 EVM.evm.TU.scf_75.9   scf_75:63744-69793(-)
MLKALRRLHVDDPECGDREAGDDDDHGQRNWCDDLTDEQARALIEACQGDSTVDLESLLPPGAMEDFVAHLQRSSKAETPPAWKPWWLSPECLCFRLTCQGMALIAEADEEQVGRPGRESLSALPLPPSEPLPSVQSLTKAPPSDVVRWQLIDMLYAYCFIVRRFHSSILSDPREVAAIALSLSRSLSSTTTSESAGVQTAREVVLEALHRATSPPVGTLQDRCFAIDVLHDVVEVLDRGRAVVVLALSDLQSCLLRAKKDHKDSSSEAEREPVASSSQQEDWSCTPGPMSIDDKNAESFPSVRRTKRSWKKNRLEMQSKLRGAGRKLLFYMAWANGEDDEALRLLGNVVADCWYSQGAASDAAVEHGLRSLAIVDNKEGTNAPEAGGKTLVGKQLIETIN